jgi:hypothetical protein
MTLTLTTVILCDHAQVREGLLFVHSGGVSRIVPGSYPASIRVHLALVVHVPASEVTDEHTVDLRFKYPDSAELIATAQIALRLNEIQGAYPGEGINVPQVVDMSLIPFPRPGQVDVQVTVNPTGAADALIGHGLTPEGDPSVVDLSFWLLPAHSQG